MEELVIIYVHFENDQGTVMGVKEPYEQGRVKPSCKIFDLGTPDYHSDDTYWAQE